MHKPNVSVNIEGFPGIRVKRGMHDDKEVLHIEIRESRGWVVHHTWPGKDHTSHIMLIKEVR